MTFSAWMAPDHHCGVGVGFTDRFGGVSDVPFDSFNLGRFGDDCPDSLSRNLEILTQATGAAAVALSGQVHGCDAVVVDDDYPVVVPGGDVAVLGRVPAADIMVTTRRDVALAIRVADCVPVLLADPEQGVIAAAHAGRVGLLAGVLQAAENAMRQLGAQQIRSWIGPHICAGCYEVPAPMAYDAWGKNPATKAVSRRGTEAIDLGGGARAVLRGRGIAVESFETCTACDRRFFSHRGDHGATGRQVGVIWLG